jgi:hypothetical protein
MGVTDDVLWRLLEARDRAFSSAHDAYQSLTHQVLEKDHQIALLKAATTEKDQEIAHLKAATNEKDAEIQMLTRAAAERLGVIRQLEASREYKAGMRLMHPWQVLRRKLMKVGRPVR